MANETAQENIKHRGIFHPAFLQAMQKYIVMDFYVAKSITKVEKVFREKRIQNVKAGYVRGLQDVMIRRYVEQVTCDSGIPELSLPFCYLNKNELEEVFDKSFFAPQMRILVRPRDILKFRGTPIPVMTDENWVSLWNSISVLLNKDLEVTCKEVCAIATGGDVEPSINDRLKLIFPYGCESYIPLGFEYKSNHSRETYVFVVAEDQYGQDRSDLFEVYIKSDVMNNQDVREIFRISEVDSGEHVKKNEKKNKFQYVIQLKCAAYDADSIVHNMHIWSATNNLRLGTRTYDLWLHLNRDSTGAILEAKFKNDELKFLADALDMEPNSDWFKSQSAQREILSYVVKNCHRQTEALVIHIESQIALRRFYLHLFLYNSLSDDNRRLHFRHSALEWGSLYKYFEEIITLIMTHALGLSSDVDNKTMGGAIRARLDSIQKAEKIDRTDDPVQMFLYFYKDIVEDGGDIVKYVGAALESIRPVRNSVAHRANNGAWRKLIDLSGVEWRRKLTDIVGITSKMSDLIKEIQDEAIRRGLRSELIDITA